MCAFGQLITVGSVVANSPGCVGGKPKWGIVVGFTATKVRVAWKFNRVYDYKTGPYTSLVGADMLIKLDKEPS